MLQLLSLAGLGGLATVKKALTGGDVKEGINLHKKMHEALLHKKIEYFDVFKNKAIKEIDTGNNNDSDTVLTKLRQEVSRINFENMLLKGKIDLLPTSFHGDMIWFMDTYIEMVNMLLNFLHFLRIWNWRGYLQVLFEFLPYCFRLNRHNYARNLSYNYVHMRALKEENAAADKYLEEGGSSGSLTGRLHSTIPFDQVIEMTINKSGKDVDGLSGNTETLVQHKSGLEFTIILLLYVNTKTRK